MAITTPVPVEGALPRLEEKKGTPFWTVPDFVPFPFPHNAWQLSIAVRRVGSGGKLADGQVFQMPIERYCQYPASNG